MIDDITINAFGDEMEKISGMVGDMIKNVGGTARKWVSTGWKKPAGLFEKATKEAPAMVRGKQVMQHVPLKDAAGKQVWKDRPDATWMGRGSGPQDAPWKDRTGVTKYLPVGDKAILTGITAASIPGTLRKEDPQGLERSRGERFSGLAGGTLGSLAGMGALAHLPFKGFGITRAIIGGIGGGIAGERLATSPYRSARRAEMPAQDPTNGGNI